MEALLGQVITIFGASALFIIVAGWLLKVGLTEGLKRETQRSIELLRLQAAKDLDEAKQNRGIEKELLTKLRTEFMAENAIRKLLQCRAWRLRTFDAIKIRLGGFEDNELRKLLVRSGAVSFRRRSDGKELWGLISENEILLDGTQGQEVNDED